MCNSKPYLFSYYLHVSIDLIKMPLFIFKFIIRHELLSWQSAYCLVHQLNAPVHQ